MELDILMHNLMFHGLQTCPRIIAGIHSSFPTSIIWSSGSRIVDSPLENHMADLNEGPNNKPLSTINGICYRSYNYVEPQQTNLFMCA